MDQSLDFVAFGVILDDIVFPDGQTQMGVLGGSGVQTAWGMAAALGDGRRVGLAAGVGEDLDRDALTPLQKVGVNLDGIRTTSYSTLRAWQILEHDGRRRHLWRIPTDHVQPQLGLNWQSLLPAYQAASHFHLSLHVEDGFPHFAEILRSKGRRFSIETQRAPSSPVLYRRLFFSRTAFFSPTEDELYAIFGHNRLAMILNEFRSSGGRYLVVRQGQQGATVYDCQHGQIIQAPAYKTKVIDAVGAGNCFCGAFAAHFKIDVTEALCHGIVAASYIVEQAGLPPHLPTTYEQRLTEIRQQVTIKPLEIDKLV